MKVQCSVLESQLKSVKESPLKVLNGNQDNIPIYSRIATAGRVSRAMFGDYRPPPFQCFTHASFSGPNGENPGEINIIGGTLVDYVGKGYVQDYNGSPPHSDSGGTYSLSGNFDSAGFLSAVIGALRNNNFQAWPENARQSGFSISWDDSFNLYNPTGGNLIIPYGAYPPPSGDIRITANGGPLGGGPGNAICSSIVGWANTIAPVTNTGYAYRGQIKSPAINQAKILNLRQPSPYGGFMAIVTFLKNIALDPDVIFEIPIPAATVFYDSETNFVIQADPSDWAAQYFGLAKSLFLKLDTPGNSMTMRFFYSDYGVGYWSVVQ
jgi:hypothetical protein